MALEAIESMEKANEHTAHLLAALDAVTKAAGITADRMTTDEAARAVADHIAAQRAEIERLTRERDEARATRSRLWRCVEGAWMSCHTCAQEYQCDDMTPTADGWICDDCKALAAEGE